MINEKIEAIYSESSDMTFIMKRTFDDEDNLLAESVVGFYYGDPSEDSTEVYATKGLTAIHTEKICKDLKAEISHKDSKIKQYEKEIKELREALLLATRNKEMKTEDIPVSMSTFYKITQEILKRDDEDVINMEDDIYGHDVTVHFHGLYCNCQDGASAYNSVIEAVVECAEECEW